ncbi:LPD29 domain-containing protein [Paenibacillus kribbensis]|uniref:LPD29 domain-containing protein n=1 Tax=Paenibacillus kribbensis TaxID=172713 RepID=UPI000838D902|nr:LPD29 domain-containing protein [Paenibacillus kribbensis]
MESIYEKASDTAKKVRKILKKEFPGVKFSVRSDTYSMGSSVNVSWTDGPIKSVVEKAIDWMQSAKFDGMSDMKITVGYEWEGKLYHGADHIDATRVLTPERRESILQHLQNTFESDIDGYFPPADWEAAERQLVDKGELKGEAAPTMERSLNAEQPEGAAAAGKPLAKVIPFPLQEQPSQALTPEQEFKYFLLELSAPIILGLEQKLIRNGKAVDELFTLVANQIYGTK